MKKITVIAVVAAIAVVNLWLMGIDIMLCLAIAVLGFAIAAMGDASCEKRNPKQTISITQAARRQQELAKA